MLVKLKNVGDAPRVVYDQKRTMKSISIGQEITVDLHGKAIAKLREAQTKGDTLLVFPVARVRVRPAGAGSAGPASPVDEKVIIPKQEVKEPPKPTEVVTAVAALAISDRCDYHQLLAMVNRVVPENKLPPRPTKPQMLDVLSKAAAKEK
jgi:hypothetical protein